MFPPPLCANYFPWFLSLSTENKKCFWSLCKEILHLYCFAFQTIIPQTVLVPSKCAVAAWVVCLLNPVCRRRRRSITRPYGPLVTLTSDAFILSLLDSVFGGLTFFRSDMWSGLVLHFNVSNVKGFALMRNIVPYVALTAL